MSIRVHGHVTQTDWSRVIIVIFVDSRMGESCLEKPVDNDNFYFFEFSCTCYDTRNPLPLKMLATYEGNEFNYYARNGSVLDLVANAVREAIQH